MLVTAELLEACVSAEGQYNQQLRETGQSICNTKQSVSSSQIKLTVADKRFLIRGRQPQR